MNAKFRKVNKHYTTDYIFGERIYTAKRRSSTFAVWKPVRKLLRYWPSVLRNSRNGSCSTLYMSSLLRKLLKFVAVPKVLYRYPLMPSKSFFKCFGN